MLSILAHSPAVGLYLFFVAIGLMIICQLWWLVLAARRSALWFFGVLILPFLGFVLMFVDRRAVRPFIICIIGFAVMVWAAAGTDNEKTKHMNVFQKIAYVLSDRPNRDRDRDRKQKEKDFMNIKAHELKPVTPTIAGARQILESRRERVRAWQLELQQKQRTLDPNDAAAKAALDREMAECLAELQKVKDEMATPAR